MVHISMSSYGLGGDKVCGYPGAAKRMLALPTGQQRTGRQPTGRQRIRRQICPTRLGAGRPPSQPRLAGQLRLLLWCGGVDRQLLVTRAEVYRYSNLGLLVLAVATLGATSFTLFATVILNHFYLALVPFALGWGILILLIDRSIITEPLYHERQARAALQQLTASTPGPERQNAVSPNGATPSQAAEPDSDLRAAPAISVAAIALPAPWKSMTVRGAVYLARVVIAICLCFPGRRDHHTADLQPEVKAQLTVLHAAEF